MKKSKRRSPIWPYLGILGCLFLLSLSAPRAWERGPRRASLEHVKQPARAARAESAPLIERKGQALERPDQAELEPRPEEFEAALEAINAARAIGSLDPMATSAEVMPPAPHYAEEVRIEEQDLATLTPAHDGELAPSELVPSEPSLAAPAIASPVEAPSALQSPEAESPAEQSPPVESRAPAAEPQTVEEPVESAARPGTWPIPRALIEQLTSLSYDDEQLIWPRRAAQLIGELCDSEPSERAAKIEALRKLIDRDSRMRAADRSLEPRIARTRYALMRWIDVWQATSALEEQPVDETVPAAALAKLRRQLAALDAQLARDSAGAGWREYLQLDELQEATATSFDAEQRREEARKVLERFASRRLSAAQQRILTTEPFTELRDQLRRLAAEPITARRLLAHIEQYEFSQLASDAALVADDLRSLRWAQHDESLDDDIRQLETHYRNANVRVVLRGELINRMVPQPGRIDAPVRDTVINVPVRGNSSTFTELSVKLVPDERRIRLGLEAHGLVDSNTISSSGPATFRNRGQATFLVRKLFVMGPRGLVVWPAIAEAESNYNYLVSLDTDYDNVPLVGSLVQNIARNQYEEQRGEARRQTERKVATRALAQLDSEIETRLLEAGKKFQREQGATLERMGLELAPVGLATTEDRVTARGRLASRVQLGAHTPRPQAPSDSWFSLQVHQSALNNGLEQLDLEGRRFELPELFAWVGEKLGRPEMAQQEDLPEDVQIKFADRDALRLVCKDGKVELTFAIAELTHEGSRWRNFEVRTHYGPEVDGLSPRFTRVDTIHLAGRSLRGKIEFKLRAIFSKVLSKNRDITLLSESVTSDPRFKDLQVTQLDIEDGWIGLAYSPRRTSSNVARKPK